MDYHKYSHLEYVNNNNNIINNMINKQMMDIDVEKQRN